MSTAPDQQEDPVRSVGHRGRVGDEVLTPDPVDRVQVGERLEGIRVGEGAEVDDVELAGVQRGAVGDEVEDVLAGLPERLVVARFEHRSGFVERRQHRADLLLERALDPVAPDLGFPDGQQVAELLAHLGDDRVLVDGSVRDLLDRGVRVQRAHHGQQRDGEARQQHSPQPAPQAGAGTSCGSDVARSPIGRGADGLTAVRPLSRWYGPETARDDPRASALFTQKTLQSRRVRSDEASMRLVDLPPKVSRDVLGYPISELCLYAGSDAGVGGGAYATSP